MMVRFKVMAGEYIRKRGDVKRALSKSGGSAVQIVLISALDLDADDFSNPQRAAA